MSFKEIVCRSLPYAWVICGIIYFYPNPNEPMSAFSVASAFFGFGLIRFLVELACRDAQDGSGA